MKGKQGKTDSFWRRISQKSNNWRPQQELIDRECRKQRTKKFVWKNTPPDCDLKSGGKGDVLPLENLVRGAYTRWEMDAMASRQN